MNRSLNRILGFSIGLLLAVLMFTPVKARSAEPEPMDVYCETLALLET